MNRLVSLFFRAWLLAFAGLLLLAGEARALEPAKPHKPVTFSSVLPYLILGVVALALTGYLVWRAMRVLARRLRARGVRRPILTSAVLFAVGLLVPILIVAGPRCRPAKPANPPPAETNP